MAVTSSPTTETYRVLRRQNMGNGRFREVGEYLPEAMAWPLPTRNTYERTRNIEKVFIGTSDFEAVMQRVRERDEALETEVLEDETEEVQTEPVSTEPVTPVETPEGEDDGEDEVQEEQIEGLGDPEPVTGNAEPDKAPAKRVVKKR